MAKLKYDVDTNADWEENLYHEVVKVVGGVAYSDEPLTIESLLYRGFSLVNEEVEPPAIVEEEETPEIVEEAIATPAVVEEAVDTPDIVIEEVESTEPAPKATKGRTKAVAAS